MSKTRKNEQGMVSILVTMIMILVITLIVLGFAEVTRRNQREALDDQLSTQAYYAAESGVNAAVNFLTEPQNIGDNVNTIGNCTTFLNTLKNNKVSSTLDATTNTQYTCLMVNTEPSTLSVSPLTQGNNQILYFANKHQQQFTQLKFSWSPETGSPYSLNTCSGSGASGDTLPSYGNWDCAYGILRLDLVDATNINNTALTNNQGTMSFYLVPSYRTGSPFTTQTYVSWPPAVQQVSPSAPAVQCNAQPNSSTVGDNCPVQIIPVSCTSSGCSLQMNFTGSGGAQQYFARLTMMYQDSSNILIAGGDAAASISPITGVGDDFAGGQALIDSTGQSGDELRRVQVRIPLSTTTNTFPVYGLQTTQSICKQIQDGPSLYTDNCPGHP